MVEDEYRGFKFIGNLSCSTNDTSLKQAAFEKFGHHLVVDKFSPGFGLDSNFEDEKKALVEAMNGIDLDGRDRDRNRDHRHGSGGTISSLPILLGNAPRVADMVEGMTNLKIDDDKIPPVLAPKKEEPVENTSPLQATTSGAPSSFKSKRQNINAEESKTTNGPPLKKKVKSEDEGESVKDETASASKSNAPPKGSTSTPSSKPVTEDEIRAVLSRGSRVTTIILVAKFKSRLKSKEAKDAFAAILRRISKIQKINGANFVVLKEK